MVTGGDGGFGGAVVVVATVDAEV